MLDLTVDQALPLVENFPPIANKLRTLQDVGLGYIKLGQSATTLSGGEAQRVKLARELARRGTGRTLYILDEPTTGLHFEDVRQLLDVLGKLVDQGNTVVVIEHNLDVIKSADWVIDLGPEGGAGGGRIVAQRARPKPWRARRESATGRVSCRDLVGAGRRRRGSPDDCGKIDHAFRRAGRVAAPTTILSAPHDDSAQLSSLSNSLNQRRRYLSGSSPGPEWQPLCSAMSGFPARNKMSLRRSAPFVAPFLAPESVCIPATRSRCR